MGWETYKSGLTMRAVLGIVYSVLVMTPVIIYLYLAAGLSDIARFIPVFVTLLLFTEVGRFTGKFVTPQEAYIIYFMSELVAYESLFFVGILQVLYYRVSPYTTYFGIASKIPSWAAPPLAAPAVKMRTFIAPEFALPIAIILIGYASSVLIDVALSFLLVELYIEVEKLPFPVAPIDAKAITVLTKRDPKRMVLFSFAAMVGFIYTFLLYSFPILTQTFMGVRIAFLPYPWIDLTSTVERLLPGAMFGIATDISTFVVGWVIPFKAALWMFITSIAVFVFGNHIALTVKNPYFARWQAEWTPGLPLRWIWQRSLYDIWTSPMIGVSVGVLVYLFVARSKYLVRAVKSLSKLSFLGGASKYISLRTILAMLAVGTLAGTLLDCALVPQLWFVWVIMWALLPFVQSLFVGRSIGEIGLGVVIPYTREAMLVSFSEAGDPAPWLVPVKTTFGAGIITHRIKVAQLVGVKPIDYYKAMAITIPLSVFFSFVYWQIFWSMAPMPSSFYPWTVIQWPLIALNFSVWVSRSVEVFKPFVIALSGVLAFVGSLIADRLSLPFSPIGFVAGFSTAPPFALNYFLGALFGKIMERRLGKETWNDYKSTLIAGLFAGIGVALGVSVALVLIGKSIWMKPF